MDTRNLLGFDFGNKRIGVAVGSMLTGSARALTTLDRRPDRSDWCLIAPLIEEWQPGRLVVGLPQSLDGEETAMSTMVRAFAGELSDRSGLPVDLVDEALSSSEARARLAFERRSGARKRRVRRGDIDPTAARVILETWLNQRRGPSGAQPS